MTGINDTLVLRENLGVVDFTSISPESFYSAPQCATALQTAINDVPGIANSYSVSYNTQNLEFMITTNLTNTFSIRSNINMLNEMGWAQFHLNTFTVTKTAAYVCDISSSHYVYIKSSSPTKTIAAGLNRNDILARIQLDVPKGNIAYFNQPVDSITIIVKRLDLEQL